jgi:hypothetical protein
MEQAKADRIFRILLIAYLVWASIYIFRSSFVINGIRYFSLFDDAMVSMRYAKNFVNGYGLVFNPGGERVEGFTNPLWVLYMSLLHIFPIPAAKISLLVQITGAVLLVANLYLIRKIAILIWNSQLIALGSVFLTSFYQPLNHWTLQGMEVGLLTLLLTFCVWRLMISQIRQKFDPLPLVLLAASTLVRMDMTVTFVGIVLFQIHQNPESRKKIIYWSVPLLLLFLGGQTWLRLIYYGEPLPNTYYLKMTGQPLWLRLAMGAWTAFLFSWETNWLLFFLPFVMVFFHREKSKMLLLWIFVVQIAYSLFVGGDSWESGGGSNRFVSIAMPEFLLLVTWSIHEVCKKLFEQSCYAFRIILVLSWITMNCTYGPLALLEVSLLLPPSHSWDNHDMVERALIIREITTPDAKVACTWAGALPYFVDRYTVDILGKNDRYVARLPMRVRKTFLENIGNYQPGHMKYDYQYSIETQQPDIVAQLWKNQEEANPILDRTSKRVFLRGYLMFLRKDSPNVFWEKVEILKHSPRL